MRLSWGSWPCWCWWSSRPSWRLSIWWSWPWWCCSWWIWWCQWQPPPNLIIIIRWKCLLTCADWLACHPSSAGERRLGNGPAPSPAESSFSWKKSCLKYFAGVTLIMYTFQRSRRLCQRGCSQVEAPGRPGVWEEWLGFRVLIVFTQPTFCPF